MDTFSKGAEDTIVAVATPPGRGGVGVVRLSGPEALRIAQMLVRLRREPESHRVRYGSVLGEDGQPIDDALVTYFAAPHSYTGEDVVEISTHGAPVVVQTVVQLSLQRGARMAHAGEFTERAFLNRRLDLSQAEAVRDLIESSTVAQARLAAEQLGGSLQRELRPTKDALVYLISALEVGIDFAEDDVETTDAAEILEKIGDIEAPLERLLRSFAYGRAVRDGLRLAIVGRPNAGKSSLFNRLLERERAIVTPIAGTTRDVVSERAVIAGIPVELMDTAGLRETLDPVEQIGVARSHEAMADADVVLEVIDAAEPGEAGAEERLREAGAPRLRVYNKSDLLDSSGRAQLPHGALMTSARTGEGLDVLRQKIVEAAGVDQGRAEGEGNATLSNVRQRDRLEACLHALERARLAVPNRIPHEMLLLDLYEALHALDALTGQTTSDDVLNQIFSSFCIGK